MIRSLRIYALLLTSLYLTGASKSLNAETPSQKRPMLPAGNEGGSGGHAIKVGHEWRLYDFFEAGIHDDVFVMPQEEDYARSQVGYSFLRQKFEKKFSGVKDLTLRKQLVDQITVLLFRVAKVDGTLANALFFAIDTLEWQFPNAKLPLVEIENPTIALDGFEIAQLAVRNGLAISLSIQMIKELALLDFSGLIFHEAISTMLYVDKFHAQGDQPAYESQDAKKLRDVVSALFDPSYAEERSSSAKIKFRVPSAPKQSAYLDNLYGNRDDIDNFEITRQPLVCFSSSRGLAKELCKPVERFELGDQLSLWPDMSCKEMKSAKYDYFKIVYPRFKLSIGTYRSKNGFSKQVIRWQDMEPTFTTGQSLVYRHDSGKTYEQCIEGIKFSWDFISIGVFARSMDIPAAGR